MVSPCNVHWLGLIPYGEAWKLQGELAAEIATEKRPATLLLLEHPHTYTFGRRGIAEHLLWDEAELTRQGVEVHWVDRGGDVTYHGPGQLVGYPLLPIAPGGLMGSVAQNPAEPGELRIPRADYIGYLRKLEVMIINALKEFEVDARQVEGLTGVWLERKMFNPEQKKQAELVKIASIGVKVDVKGISRHGFSLNVAPDMKYWQGIIACGLKDYHETSLADLLSPAPNLQQVGRAVVASFAETFNYEMIEAPLG